MPDVYTDDAVRLISESGTPIIVTPHGILETINAMNLGLFRRPSTQQEVRRSERRFSDDLAAGFYLQAGFPVEAWVLARMMSEQHTGVIGARSGDILHVAAAKVLRAETFLTFDHRQARLARAVGLAVAGVPQS